MTNITLQIERETDLQQLLELIRRLNLSFVQHPQKQAVKIAKTERQKMIDFILNFQNDRPSFGDAAEWQRTERADRELPFSA